MKKNQIKYFLVGPLFLVLLIFTFFFFWRILLIGLLLALGSYLIARLFVFFSPKIVGTPKKIILTFLYLILLSGLGFLNYFAFILMLKAEGGQRFAGLILNIIILLLLIRWIIFGYDTLKEKRSLK